MSASRAAGPAAPAAPRIVRWSEARPGEAVREAAEALERGDVVAHPTETVYGFAAAAEIEAAYRRLLGIKGGAVPRAFLLLFETPEALERRLGALPPGGEELARRFWPGPLTLLFPAPADVPAWWSGPDGDVAARVSPHRFCRDLLQRLGEPVLSTSANASGEPPLSNAPDLAASFAGRGLALVVDGGRLEGRPSTLLRWTEDRGWTTLRQGPVTEDEIRAALEEGPP